MLRKETGADHEASSVIGRRIHKVSKIAQEGKYVPI